MKKKNAIHVWIRRGIGLFFLLLLPDLYTSAFNGVKYIAAQAGSAGVIELTPFISILIILLAFTFLFGRFFCGYACAFGFLGDLLYSLSAFLQKKIHKRVWQIPDKPRRILRYMKYLILAVILLLTFLQAYDRVSRFDPWQIFAGFLAGDFALKGKTAGFAVLVLIAVGMCFVERFFCLFLCPMGAVFSMIPVLPASGLRRDPSHCAGKCHQCEKNCPAGYFRSFPREQIPDGYPGLDKGESVNAEPDGKVRDQGYGECIACMKCANGCPVGNAGCGGFRSDSGTGTRKVHIRGNEWYILLLKAGILFVIVYLLNTRLGGSLQALQ